MTRSAMLIVTFTLALTSSPVVGAYFNRMMSCEQFCKSLTKDYVRQVWCILNVCHETKMQRSILSYAKRSRSGTVVAPSDDNVFDTPLAPSTRLSLPELLEKRVKEYLDVLPARNDAH